MKDYPDNEFPWTFYFNGEAMPRWGQCWMSCSIERRAAEEMQNWQGRLTAHDLFLLSCKIDHVGVAESDDVLRFRACVRLLLKMVLLHGTELAKEAAEWGSCYGGTGQEVIAGIRDTLIAMSVLAERDGIAVWTTGYEADRIRLCEVVRRVRLPRDSAEWLELPHEWNDRRETQLHLEFLRKDLVKMVREGGWPKDIRRAIHEMRVERESPWSGPLT